MNRFGLSENKTIMVNASIDCQRFNPGSGPLTHRKEFGMKDDDMVVGIIAESRPTEDFT